MDIPFQLLEQYREGDGDFLEHRIMGDEAWVHRITLETAVDSMTQKHQLSLTPTKIQSSAVCEEIHDSYVVHGLQTAQADNYNRVTVKHWTN